MKEAKNQFDGLVEQIKLGETVQFGQMENLFARALLGRFLEQLKSKDFRERAEQLHRERILAQEEGIDEDTKLPALSEKELVAYELDQARTAIGVLGVRPELKQMRPYVEKAIDQRDWRLLNTVVSLTEEGRLEKGTLETIVLDSLLRTPAREEGDTPSTVRSEFGGPHYTREFVEPVYVRALADGNIEGVKAVHEETKITIPPTLVQTTYEKFAGVGSAESIKRLAEVTGIKPEKTSALRASLIKLVETKEIGKETWDEIDAVLDIQADPALAKALQLAAVRNGKVSTFFDLYNGIDEEGRVAASNVRDAYDALSSTDAIDAIIQQVMRTGIAPRKKVLTKIYLHLLQKGEFARMKAMEPVTRFAKMAHQAGRTIAEEHVEKAAQLYLENSMGWEERGLKGRIRAVDELYSLMKLKPSETITVLKLERRVKELKTTLKELVNAHTEGYKTPLEPVKGRNLSEWRQYSKAATNAVQKHIKDLQTIRKAHPACSIGQHLQTTATDSRFIQETYAACLETFLTQCLMDEETVNLPQLIDAVGIPINENAICEALIDHIIRNSEKQDARKVLKNAQKAGLTVILNDKKIDEIGKKILVRSSYRRDIEGIKYLKDLIGEKVFPPNLQEAVQVKSMFELGINGNIENYDALQSVLSIKRPPTAGEAQTIRNKIIQLLAGGGERERKNAGDIQQRAGISLTATPSELEAMVNRYFAVVPHAAHPTLIAKTFNATLNPEQIQKRYKALLVDKTIADQREVYDLTQKLGVVSKLHKDTGVVLDREFMIARVDSAPNSDKGALVQGFGDIFGFRYEPADLQQRCKTEMEKIKDDVGKYKQLAWGYIRAMLETHDVAPEKDIATSIYAASVERLADIVSYGRRHYYDNEESTHLPKIVRRLRELNVPAEDSLATRVKEMGLKEYGLHNARLIECIYKLQRDYQRADILTPTEIAKITKVIDADFKCSNASNNTTYFTNVRDLSFVYAQANKQIQANENATRIYTQQLDNRFPLYAYCTLTGARPNIGTAELAALKQEIEDRLRQAAKFRTDQREKFVEMINGWEGAA